MNRFEKLNLAYLLNHKLVYDTLPADGKEFGLDDICILREDFKFEPEEKIDGTEFQFFTGEHDNVICGGQRLEVGIAAEKLHVIGFGYWGDICEAFKVVYDDGSEENMQIVLPDWSHSGNEDVMARPLCGKKEVYTAKIVLSSGRLKHLIYFHHSACTLKKNKTIREIVLPDNMFLHIFAVTLER